MTPLRDFLDALVHPSARDDAAAAEHHLAFIAPRLCGSLLALGAFPLVLGRHGVPTAAEFLVLAWTVVPIAVAWFLSRTGRYEIAQGLSALALTAVVTVVAAASGGMNSLWLVLIPLEAAIGGSRRAIVATALLATGGAGLLAVAGSRFGLRPAVEPSSLVTLGTLSAVVYATGLTLCAGLLMRSLRLYREDDPPPFAATDVVTWHGRGGRVVRASANAEAVLGTPPADLAGHGLFDRIHVADRPAFLHTLSAAAGGEIGEIEFRLQRPHDAAFAWIEMRCRPAGRRGCADAVAVMRDVSARKRHEDELAAARSEAARANAAKSRYLASMSHELRTPLNAIIGFSEMLLEDDARPLDAARRRDYARIIGRSGHHLLAVANAILDMSRLETGEPELFPEWFAPIGAVTAAIELLSLQSEQAGVTLAVEAPPDLPCLFADRRAVMQILINLIANAIAFTGRGGTVTVRAGADRGEAVFEVLDTGVGMTADDLARVGRPYFRGRHDACGTGGLGLSIVKALLDLHGGTLQASSERGKGTRMTVRLPRDGADGVEATRVQKRA